MRHRKREQVFDWSLTALPHEPRVQWAAFYSDCEHEVQKVESGVCITVVYNLMTSPTPAPYLKVRRLILKTLRPSCMRLACLWDELVEAKGCSEIQGQCGIFEIVSTVGSTLLSFPSTM